MELILESIFNSPILPIGVSILAVSLNYNTRSRTSRKEFCLVLIAISVVPLVVTYADMTKLFGWSKLPFSLSPPVLYLSWTFLAGPFYQRLCRRILDAGLSKSRSGKFLIRWNRL